jgi:hypothetical protein
MLTLRYMLKSTRHHAHHKAGLVKVVGVFILDAVLRLRVLYKLEPPSNSLRILTQGSLVVVLAIELDFKLRSALNKLIGPVLRQHGPYDAQRAKNWPYQPHQRAEEEALARQGQVYAGQSHPPLS